MLLSFNNGKVCGCMSFCRTGSIEAVKTAIAILQILILLLTDIVPARMILVDGCGSHCACSSGTKQDGQCCCQRNSKQSTGTTERSEGQPKSCCAKSRAAGKKTDQTSCLRTKCDSSSKPNDGGLTSRCLCNAQPAAITIVHPSRSRVSAMLICTSSDWTDRLETFDERESVVADPPDPFPPDSAC